MWQLTQSCKTSRHCSGDMTPHGEVGVEVNAQVSNKLDWAYRLASKVSGSVGSWCYRREEAIQTISDLSAFNRGRFDLTQPATQLAQAATLSAKLAV
jgi:hypothetical protein